jgi:glycerate 2-kinase
MAAALAAQARRIIVGLGGSATTDGGAGMLAALGARAWDSSGAPTSLDLGGDCLARIARIDLEAVRAALGTVDLIAATDVDSPLLGEHGAARGFAPQKGASIADVEALEASLRDFASVTAATDDLVMGEGAGAAGGLGFGLMLAGGRRESGIAVVREAVDLDDAIASSDLVITGEGSFDWQSLRGKVVTGVAEAALEQGRPTIVIAGRVDVGRREAAAIGVTAAYPVSHGGPGSGRDAATALARCAEAVAGQWSTG